MRGNSAILFAVPRIKTEYRPSVQTGGGDLIISCSFLVGGVEDSAEGDNVYLLLERRC